MKTAASCSRAVGRDTMNNWELLKQMPGLHLSDAVVKDELADPCTSFLI